MIMLSLILGNANEKAVMLFDSGHIYIFTSYGLKVERGEAFTKKNKWNAQTKHTAVLWHFLKITELSRES